MVEVAGPRLPGGLRERAGAARPRVHLLRPRHFPHGPALHHLGAHLQGGGGQGLPDQALRGHPGGQDARRVLPHRGPRAGEDLHGGVQGAGAPGGGPEGLQPPRRQDRQHDRRGRGGVLLLHPLPVLRPQPRLHRHPAAPGPVRGLHLAGLQGLLPDQRARPQRAGQEGGNHRRREGAVEEHQRLHRGEVQRQPEEVQRLLDHGGADDLLRLLRVHRRGGAGGQRGDDRGPRLHRA